jgi:Zn-dependent peptidase ImmA (M78 family)
VIFLETKKADRKDKIPVLSDKEIDGFAREVLLDYRPELLKEPSKIDWEHFLEHYGLCIAFVDFYSDDPKKPIYAATAFNRERILVFDRETASVKEFEFAPNTVIIDRSVMASGNEGFIRFTALHESGHFLMHRRVYREVEDIICCRKPNIESFGKVKKKRTNAEWREHQADYFASAIAMPNDTFFPFVREIIRTEGLDAPRIGIGQRVNSDRASLYALPEAISETFGVSLKAAKKKKKKTGIVIERKEYEKSAEAHPRVSDCMQSLLPAPAAP